MSDIIIMNGKDLAEELLPTQQLNYSDKKRPPCLVVITIGDDEASKVYLKNKKKLCDRCGITYIHEKYSSDANYMSLVDRINELNDNPNVDGIIVQKPVPNKFSNIEQNIKWYKDVDGFTSQNVGNLFTRANDYNTFMSCTPYGILTMLKHYEVPMEGKHVVILGRSTIVGKPLIGILLNENCTVTSCNSYTENLKDITKSADILISAIGIPKHINHEYISLKCKCIIDVGINRDENNKLCGDCDFEDIVTWWNNSQLTEKRYITPVPNGVGPMTVYSLIRNVNSAYTINLFYGMAEDRGSN